MKPSLQCARWLVCCALFALMLPFPGNPAAGQSNATDSAAVAVFDTAAAEAIVVLDSSLIIIADDGSARFRATRRYLVKREAGREYAEHWLYENVLQTVREFSGRAYDADGNIVLERNRKDLERSCGFGAAYSLYDDICRLSFSLSAGNYPVTVEFSYEIELHSLFNWPDWRPQAYIPVLRSCYEIDAPASFTYRIDTVGNLPDPVVDSAAGGRVRTQWSIANVPALRKELHAPPLHESSLRVEFAPATAHLREFRIDYDDWSTLGRDCFEIFRKSFELDKDAAKFASTLLTNRPPTLSELESLHRQFLERQRYVSINIGIGGWQPHVAAATFKNRYGDCKDLATLYSSLLAQAGVKARPVLIRTRDIGPLNPDFPTLSNFNHAILMYTIGNDTVWVDGTCTVCALGDLPDVDEGRFVLLLDPDSAVLLRTPDSPAESNLILRKASIDFYEDISARLTIDITARGNPSHDLINAARYLKPEDLCVYLREQNLVPPSLRDPHCKVNYSDSSLSHFACTVTGYLRRAGLNLQERVHFDPDAFPSVIGFERPDIKKRRLPLDYGSALLVLDSIFVIFPEQWEVAQLPPRDSIVTQFGALTIAADSIADTVKITRSHVRRQPRVDHADFAAFIEHQKSCSDLTAISTVFSRPQ